MPCAAEVYGRIFCIMWILKLICGDRSLLLFKSLFAKITSTGLCLLLYIIIAIDDHIFLFITLDQTAKTVVSDWKA